MNAGARRHRSYRPVGWPRAAPSTFAVWIVHVGLCTFGVVAAVMSALRAL